MRVLIFALALIAAPLAAAADTYLVATAGQSTVEFDCGDADTCEYRGFAGSLAVGYELRPDVAVEVQAARLGSIRMDIAGASVGLNVDGLGAHVLLGGPSGAGLTARVAAGAVRWRSTVEAGDGSERGRVREYGTDPYVGLVLDYRGADRIGARASWIRYLDVAGGDTTAISVGATVRF